MIRMERDKPIGEKGSTGFRPVLYSAGSRNYIGQGGRMREQKRRPDWLRVQLETGEEYRELKKLLGDLSLNTVCRDANCPNLHECWNAGTATFLILGDTCTRHCSFCSVGKGKPEALDAGEPARLAEAVARMKCRHVVLTSVDRDDLPDGGSGHWAASIRAIHSLEPSVSVETLVPDFQGDPEALDRVLEERPAVFSHNVETVPELYRSVRTDSDFERSLSVLRHAHSWKKHYPLRVKSGLMLGLGESRFQLLSALERVLESGCEVLTLGQYLPPSRQHLQVERFLPPEEFEELKQLALSMGFLIVESAPFVRSSYHAERHLPGA
jgi:lipoic acid synthetase